MICSPCKDCQRKNLPKDICIKDCSLLNKIQDLSLSEPSYDGSAIDYSDEYSCNVHIALGRPAFR